MRKESLRSHSSQVLRTPLSVGQGLTLALGLFVALFVLSSVMYLVLHYLLGIRWVFGVRMRMFLYHFQHPFQYIALFCACYTLLVAPVISRWPRLEGWARWAAMLGVLLLCLPLASVAGGVLWKIHDMQAGYFPEGARFWTDLQWGAFTGLQLGWWVLAMSVPFNGLCLAGFAGMTAKAFEWARRQPETV